MHLVDAGAFAVAQGLCILKTPARAGVFSIFTKKLNASSIVRVYELIEDRIFYVLSRVGHASRIQLS